MADNFTIHVDGEDRTIAADGSMPLLYALIGELGKRGPKFGCGLAQCGACTVLHDGFAVRSCTLPLAAVTGKVRTLDGLAPGGKPHPVQEAFIAEEAGQCEYCINGWIMTAVALLERKASPSDADIRAALAGLKCRCGTHMAILRGIRRAAAAMAAEAAGERDG